MSSIDVNTVRNEVLKLQRELGQAVMSNLYPKDFEYYMMALELVGGDGSTIDYFAFPILPSAISKSENKRINIKKAFKSTLVLTSTAFTPQDITIRGNFGRNFKILIGGTEIMSGLAFSTKSGVFGLNGNGSRSVITTTPQFSQHVKTGYGATKLLQSIIQKSDGSDQNGPYRLFLYNFALGESYLVVAPSKAMTLDQNDKDSNMIWQYSLNLTIIAPMELIKSARPVSSLFRLFALNTIQNSANRVGKEISGYIQRIRV